MSDNKKVKDVAGKGKGLGAYYKGKAKDYKMIIPIEPPKPVKKAMLGMLMVKKAMDNSDTAKKRISVMGIPGFAASRMSKATGGSTKLKGGQKKLDINKDGKISGEDFKMMKKSTGGEMKKGYGAARQSGMGLQDENLIPGKNMDYYKDLI